jgi:hypothetical protein
MLKKGDYWHEVRENLLINVCIFKPDVEKSNTVLGPNHFEKFLERREPKIILKTVDRAVYELLEGEVYMEVKEVDMVDRHLWDTEIATIDVFEKGKDPKLWMYKILWFEPNSYELIIGKQRLKERLKELQTEAIFMRQEELSFLSENSKAGG